VAKVGSGFLCWAQRLSTEFRQEGRVVQCVECGNYKNVMTFY